MSAALVALAIASTVLAGTLAVYFGIGTLNELMMLWRRR